MTEQQAKAETLRRCRAQGCEWVMRNAPKHPMAGSEWSTAFRVLDGAAWVQDRVIAEGDTWLEVLGNLPPEREDAQ
jgi:hypothetical protein